ncbi:hypothetical protein [Flexithrix dorotheae]|uniref:hypothetical protein n=1 Tax=Flexithrix dorotheae TaxID=70993 RepID=UPI00037C0B8D|nr:hypothetical protein [Flexithrix dorotheae]
MAELLKNQINPAFIQNLSSKIKTKNTEFNDKEFRNALINPEWEGLELKQRVRKISNQLHLFLGNNYLENLSLILDLAPSFKGLSQMVFPDYVEVYGLSHFSESVQALKELTPFFSSEFAIRPFILKNQSEMMKIMLEWSLDENEHVRRLSSEGCRPRLPWAMGIKSLKQNPFEILPILENLKNDPSLYVRKSVANNLNDISKDHPELALKLFKGWYGKSENTNWIIKHGCRTLLKQGNKEALSIFGFNSQAKIKIQNFKLSNPKIKLGDRLDFSFDLILEGDQKSNIRLEYFIYYLKSNGAHSKKIFKISEGMIENRKKIKINKSQVFKNFTTRKHYFGEHKISLVINGEEQPQLLPFYLET